MADILLPGSSPGSTPWRNKCTSKHVYSQQRIFRTAPKWFGGSTGLKDHLFPCKPPNQSPLLATYLQQGAYTGVLLFIWVPHKFLQEWRGALSPAIGKTQFSQPSYSWWSVSPEAAFGRDVSCSVSGELAKIAFHPTPMEIYVRSNPTACSTHIESQPHRIPQNLNTVFFLWAAFQQGELTE